MDRGRGLRGGHDGRERPFDWLSLARRQGIPVQQARALYDEAVRRAGAHREPRRHVEAIYVELLAAARQQAWRPSPGKVTRTMRLEAERAGQRRGPRVSRLTGEPIAPGKRTLTSYLEPPGPGRRAVTHGRVEDELAAAEWESPAEDLGVDAGARPDDEHDVPLRNVVGLRDAWPAQDGGQMDGNAWPWRQTETHAPVQMKADTGAAAPVQPPPGARIDADGGQPLPEDVRAVMERAFGRDFSHVRIHTDARAAVDARRLGARAFTMEHHVFFGAGEFAPGTPQGDRLLVHELTHVVQHDEGRVPGSGSAISHPSDATEREAEANESRMPAQFGTPGATPAGAAAIEEREALPRSSVGRPARDAPISRQPSPEVILFTGGGDPLAQYTALREAITAQQWAGLNNAARRREQRLAGQQGPAQGRDTLVEITVPLATLFRPQPDSAATEGSWTDALFALATSQLESSGRLDAPALASIVQQELVRRWHALNGSILRQTIRVALIDPQGTLPAGSTLTFQLAGNPVSTMDGALYLSAVDAAGPHNLPLVQQEMAPELESVGREIELAHRSAEAIRITREDMARGHRELAANGVSQRLEELRELHQQMRGVGGRIADRAVALGAFISDEFAPFAAEHERFSRRNAPAPSVGETLRNTANTQMALADEIRQGGGFLEHLAASQLSQSAVNMHGSYFLFNLFSFGAVDQTRQLNDAYRAGEISLATLEEATDEVNKRALIMGGITLALTIATMGLAGPVLGTGAGLGSQMLYWGGGAAITSMSSMTAGSLYTSSRTFSDPTAQALWSQGEYTPGQIALGGAVSFGLGVLGPAMQWLFRGGNAQVARQLVVASESGQVLPGVPGIEARVAGPGVVTLRVPQQPGVVEITRQGWRFLMQAGSEDSVIASGSWVDDLLQPAGPNYPSYLSGDLHGLPFTAGVTPRGWGVYSPNSASPFQLGLWDEFARPGGAGAPFAPGGLPGSGSSPLPLASHGPGSTSIVPFQVPQTSIVPFQLPQPSIGPFQPGAGTAPSLGTSIVTTGTPGWGRVPGNAPVTSPTTGQRRLMWQYYEDQVGQYLRARSNELQVVVPLPQATQFAGRAEPQNSIILDYRSTTGDLYAEFKHRNWTIAASVDDLVGSIQRIYTAQGIDAATLPQAANAPIVVFTARPMPAQVHNEVVRRVLRWLQDQGMSGQQALQALERLRFHLLRPDAPP
jgi:hypothetical protein